MLAQAPSWHHAVVFRRTDVLPERMIPAGSMRERVANAPEVGNE